MLEKAAHGRRRQRDPLDYLSEREIADRLGVSQDTLYRLRSDPVDPLPHHRVGRRVVYRPDEVAEWSKRRARRATPKAEPRRRAASKARPSASVLDV